ncbi:hypothetical protein D3C80_773930 [compost metagenome]
MPRDHVIVKLKYRERINSFVGIRYTCESGNFQSYVEFFLLNLNTGYSSCRGCKLSELVLQSFELRVVPLFKPFAASLHCKNSPRRLGDCLRVDQQVNFIQIVGLLENVPLNEYRGLFTALVCGF